MATAQIKINGTDAQFATVTIGVAVNLSNHDSGGETTYTWSIVDQPEGTGDSLSSTSVRDVAFTPTKEGSYELQLTVNSLLIQTAVVAVLDARTHERVPAATETVEAGSSQGWALAVKRILNRTLHASVDANLVVAVSPGSIAAGTIVSLTGVSTINSGTQASFQAPGIAAALGTVAHSNKLGVLIDGVVPGSIGAGALVLVRMFGLVPTSASGSPSVGATVFLSNTATPALTAGTVPRAIGYVAAAAGGSYQWVIDSEIRAQLGGSLIGIQRLSATGTYTPTPGTVTAIFKLQAGGGGGGGVATNGAGAGGNSGFYGEHHVTNAGGITGGAVTIGAGGAGGANTGATGSTGGDTSLVINGTTFTVKGGTGGAGQSAITVGVSIASNAASGSTAGMDVPAKFGPGMPSVILASNNGASGAGGDSPFGSPGQPVNTSGGAGKAGTLGAGGSGACGSTAVGGAGGDGLVLIYEHS